MNQENFEVLQLWMFLHEFKISNNNCYVLNGSGRINVIALTYFLLQVSQNTARILCEPLF